MEVRDWVQDAAGQALGTVPGAIAALNDLEPESNWSVEEEGGWFYLMAGDQWIGRAAIEAEFALIAARPIHWSPAMR